MNGNNGVGNASYYEQYYSEREPSAYSWLLAEIIAHGRSGNILDLGCGVGLFVALADSWGIEVAGIDGAPDAIDIARRKFPSVDVRHGYLSEPLPFPDQSFDNVLLNQVIEHLPEKTLTSVLAEGRRCLRSQGVAFIFSPSKANRREVLADPTHCNPKYPSELRTLLLGLGFKVIREPNQLSLLASMPGVRRLAPRLMKTRLGDWISLSANAYAQKP